MDINKINYIMYGISIPYSWHKEWELKTGKDFHNTFDEYLNNNNKDGIFCCFDGRDGKHLIIGKILNKLDDYNNTYPIEVQELNNIEKKIIESNVNKFFGLDGNFCYYFVTHLT